MAGTLTIPLTTLAPGPHAFGPLALADSDTGAKLTVDRTPAGGFNSLTSATTGQVTAEQSNDGGATWFGLGGSGAAGGLIPDRHAGGNCALIGVAVTLWPGTGRRARAVVTIGGPASATVTGSLVIT